MSHAQVTASEFVEELHPRAADGKFGSGSGSTSGGKTAPRKAPAKKAPKRKGPVRRTIPAGQLGFDGVRGTGYGQKGGDKRVRALQEQLNRLGLTDLHGKKLAVDGKLGPLTTSAIKAAQLRLGMRPTGIIAPAFIDRLAATRVLPAAKHAPVQAPAKKAASKPKAAPRHRPARTPAPPKERPYSALGRVEAKFNPLQPRDADGKWAHGGVGDLLASLVSAHSERDDVLFPRTSDGIINWAERRDDGSYGFEVRGDNGDTVYIDLDEDHLRGLHSALTKALTGDDPGLYLAGSSDLQFDWSDVTEEDDHLTGEPIRVLNVLGEDDNGELGASTSVQMTEQDMRDWHSALTITLLRALASPSSPPPVTASQAQADDGHVFDNGICVTCEGGA